MASTRVLVCGGRNFNDWDLVQDVLDKIQDISCIISGCAKGADSLALDYAILEGIDRDEFPADWNKYGKSAGYIRNKQMLIEGKPDLVVAFPGGKGTAMMVKIAREAGVEVIEVNG